MSFAKFFYFFRRTFANRIITELGFILPKTAGKN